MGTLENKLEYLHETKKGLRVAINTKLPTVKQLASTAPFRNYIAAVGEIDTGTTTGLTGIKTAILSDAMGAEIQGVGITLTNLSTEAEINITSNSNGSAYAELEAGTYSVSIQVPSGFSCNTTPSEVTVVDESVTNVYFYLAFYSFLYGVKIDLADSDPTTSVTYTDGAVAFSPSYSDFANGNAFVDNGWGDRWPFNEIKPCLFKNGAVVKYLNPNNYAKDIDGNDVDITTGAAGDVMIEIPKIYYKLSNDANYQYVQISSAEAEGFCCKAHKYKAVEKDKVYIGAYHGFYDGTSLRSLSGKAPKGTKNLTNFRNYAQANGTGYELFYFHLLTLLQCLYTIRFKSLDSQSKLGYGWCKVSETIKATNTGGANTKGLNYGESGTAQIKFCGIEDFYGNVMNWIDGVYYDSSRNILTYDTESASCVYNDTGSGYKTTITGLSADVSGFSITRQGTNDAGFCPKTGGGSATTYYCDNGTLYASSAVYFGGYYSCTANAGAFFLYNNAPTNTFASLGGRLAFCG